MKLFENLTDFQSKMAISLKNNVVIILVHKYILFYEIVCQEFVDKNLKALLLSL
jgi:hypothetical protein